MTGSSQLPSPRQESSAEGRLADPKAPSQLVLLLLVCAGGAVGTGLRYVLSGMAPFSWYFYTGTFIANIVACGCYMLISSYLAAALWIQPAKRELISRSLCMGLCGGLSTLSALLVEVFLSARNLHPWEALTYLLLTAACGLSVGAVGAHLGKKLAALRSASKPGRQ